MLTIFQIAIDVGFALGLSLLWMKFSRPPKEDPRLSRGLQLLQSKIAVLEDLSDRTDTQVSQLSALLDRKCRDLNKAVADSEKQVQLIEQSVQKSLTVAEIFQDKIPHDEIIERQRTQKYVAAAKMANQGLSAQEISHKIDLPLAEISFISKVNKDNLIFNEAQLPAWAHPPVVKADPQEGKELESLGNRYREALGQVPPQ